ncbi:MAG: dihydrofolate reductase [Solirubrobacteraceae bacterium]|nr:dihydrofolate reductase [Solirubrobacteraceae bacterium]
MSHVTCQLSISLDGYLAGPNQSIDDPLGEGGERLHHWVFPPDNDVDRAVAGPLLDGNGAYIMGRNMFGPDRGAWDLDWKGWWGPNPPYHTPVYVLSHQPRDPVEMEGGTTFHFVTDGIESALEQARAAAGDLNVCIAGGASTFNQYLAAGLLDEMHLHIVPLLFGAGERLFDGVGDTQLEQVESIGSPVVTHVRYRVVR